jgi:hypothetical protein
MAQALEQDEVEGCDLSGEFAGGPTTFSQTRAMWERSWNPRPFHPVQSLIVLNVIDVRETFDQKVDQAAHSR